MHFANLRPPGRLPPFTERLAMPRFRQGRYEVADAVTVRLSMDGGSKTGAVFLPEASQVGMDKANKSVSLEANPSGAPAAEIISYARAKATELGCDVYVIDPHGLWESSWGDLQPDKT